MATSAAVSQSQSGNNAGYGVVDEPVRELIDISQMHVEPISIAANGTFETEENVNQSTNETPAPTVASKAAKKSRAKVAMAHKHLLGGKDLFVDPKYIDRYAGPDDLVVEGKIVKCPNEKTNGSCYKVDWMINLPNTVDPGCLRHWYHKDTMTKPLRSAILAYDDARGGQPNKQKRKTPPASGKEVAATPPDQGRWRSRSAIRTAASAVSVTTVGGHSADGASTISSLSRSHGSSLPTTSTNNNNDSSPPGAPRRATRLSTMSHPTITVESDSDEGSDMNEDENAHTYANDQPESLAWGLGDESSSSDEEYMPGSIPRVRMAQLLDNIDWQFQEVQANDPAVNDDDCCEFQGTSCLRNGIAESFSEPFESLVGSGLTYEFMARLSANSNDYYYKHIKPELGQNKYHQCDWKDITTEEMYRFFGIMLKISLQPVDGGGYPAYFRTTNKELSTGFGSRAKKLIVLNTTGFAATTMSLKRFKQIRGAFHPEHKRVSNSGDKCYQLRAALNQLNAASLATFDPGKDLTFDEGGVACRSRLCPVRQYNKDKPDKYRVDFFILADARTYAVLHVDVYQGKNPRDINIHEAAKGLPTTQKAVVNAVMQTQLHTETRAGYRHLSLDNRYQCPELAFLLRERCRLYSSGTCRRKRKGWNKDIMNLSKEETPTKVELAKGMVGGGRGQYKLAYDAINNILMCQWRDSKVVNCVSTLMDTSIDQVVRHRGPIASFLECPKVLVKYQQTMFGVDKGDQMRLHGGGFARKAHFQKWYKRSFMAIMDFMLLNSLIKWNMSAKERPDLHRCKFSRHDFYTWIAEALLQYEDPARKQLRNPLSPNVVRDAAQRKSNIPSHVPGPSKSRSFCQVCRLEANISDSKELKRLAKRNCVACMDPSCRIVAHNHVPAESLKLHELIGAGLTCFDIAHSEQGLRIWEPDNRGLKTVPYKVKTSHPIVQAVRSHYGLNPTKVRKSTGTSTGTNDDDD